MIIEQLYTACLAEAAYYIESRGEAAIIDPLRETAPYLNLAKKRNTKIKYVLETHFHADFVSGHIDLANKTGATIVYGPTTMQTGFDAHIARDGEILELGAVKIKVIHTPGHTMESACYLLIDEQGKESALFSGDTLFIGDVGRPDLAQKVIAELTQEKLAGHLYDSLRYKIMPLADDIVIYPGHGAGSACGKNMSKETSDTLGHQKRVNYALNPSLSKEQFIKEVLNGLTPPPAYFPQNVLLNIKGYENVDELINRGSRALSPAEFEMAADTGALILDCRDAQEFCKAFVPGAINIGLNGSFAVWAGTLIPDLKQSLLLVCNPGEEKEAIIRLLRVGFNNVIGYLDGGIPEWTESGKHVDTIKSINAEELELQLNEPNSELLDVRKTSEYNSEHLLNAINAPLDYIKDSMLMLDRNKTYYVYCAGGYRSMTFISILKRWGYNHLVDVKGGISALKNSGKFQLTEYVRPTTML